MFIQIKYNASVENALKSGVLLSAKSLGYYATMCEADDEICYPGIKEYLRQYVEDGSAAISSGIRELIEKGFLEKRIERTPHGAFVRTTYVVTLPENEDVDKALRRQEDKSVENFKNDVFLETLKKRVRDESND